jgi:hypothetical protein
LTRVSLNDIVSANGETDLNVETVMKESEIIEQLQELIKEILDKTGTVKAIRTGLGGTRLLSQEIKPDLVIQAETQEKQKYLIVFEVKSTGQPRYARMAANQLQSIRANRENVYGVFGAPFISEESKKICQESGIGYLDLGGNCLLRFNNVYISVEGKPNPYPSTRPLKSIFATKSTRALRVLLCNPKRDWFVKDLAKEANISLGQTSNLKKRLLEFEFIKEIDNEKALKFRLSDPEVLLNRWAEYYSYRENRTRNYYSLDDVKAIEKKLSDYCETKKIRYAYTLTSGASLVAPFLRYKRVFVYLPNSIEKVALALGWKEIPSGPNITILEPYDEGVFYGLQEINGMKVVSDAQLYLDLKGYKERGEEAAQFLLENRLRKQW